MEKVIYNVVYNYIKIALHVFITIIINMLKL